MSAQPTFEQLSEQLAQQTAMVKRLQHSIDDINRVAWRQAGVIDTLVDQHLAGEADKLAENLQRLADYRAAQLRASANPH